MKPEISNSLNLAIFNISLKGDTSMTKEEFKYV